MTSKYGVTRIRANTDPGRPLYLVGRRRERDNATGRRITLICVTWRADRKSNFLPG